MKKLLYVLSLSLLVIPNLTLASWWNPLTWSKKESAPVVQEQPKEIEVIKEVIKEVPKTVIQTITVKDPTLQKQINELILEINRLKVENDKLLTENYRLLNETKKIIIPETKQSQLPSIVVNGGWATGEKSESDITLIQFTIFTTDGYIEGQNIDVNVRINGVKSDKVIIQKPDFINKDSKGTVTIRLKGYEKTGETFYQVQISATDQNDNSFMYPESIEGMIVLK